jgi:hypothetical protein
VEEADLADRWSEVHEEIGDKWRLLANDPATEHSPELATLTEAWEQHRAALPDFTERPPIAWFLSGANPSFYGVQITQA